MKSFSWLTTRQAAAQLSVPVRQLYRLIDAGDLDAYRVEGEIKLRAGDVTAYRDRPSALPASLVHSPGAPAQPVE